MNYNKPNTTYLETSEQLDFLCNYSKSSLYYKRPFVNRKKKWSFHCINCEQKFSSDNEEMTHYYVWNYPEFGEPISNYKHYLLCSIRCLHGMLEKINLDVHKWNMENKLASDQFEAFENERRKRELRDKEDEFMKNFMMAPKLKKRRHSK